ncbi:MAG: hypothetical protein Q7R30_03840 [Acidobacteriota bacterium]|nr:hypothetical protein [Acidobacteriota bacterium]
MRVMPFVRVGIVTVLVSVSLSAQNLSVELQRITQQETVTGDLRAAIDGYKKIVARAGANREVAARALVRMAECYQKLGDSEAQRIYERLLREYGDQKDAAAIARERLGVRDATSRVASERAVLKGPNVDGFGTVSADGRYLTYVDLATRQVTLRDVKAGTDRPLTTGPREVIVGRDVDPLTAISRDGRQVAFEWAAPKTGEIELRIVNVQGTGVPEARRLLALPLDDALEIAPFDWSPDAKWLAVAVQRKDLVGQLALVSVQDGSLRVLKSTAWNGPHRAFFSPDGRYLAYSLSGDDSLDESRVFVMAVDGSRESTVVDYPSRNIIMGWSPDGTSVLFGSDRTGSFGLWSVAVSDGQARGAATLLKANIGSSWSLGVTASGTLYVWKQTMARYLQVAPIDVGMGTASATKADSFQAFLGPGGNPVWSADGKYLAYMSGLTDENVECCSTFSIRTADGSLVRKLPRRLAYLQRFSWSMDGRALIGRGRDLKGRWGTYRVDVQTGEPTRIGDGDEFMWPNETPDHRTRAANTTIDGTKLYHRAMSVNPSTGIAEPGRHLLERELSSGTDRVIFEDTAPGAAVFLSPDTRHIAFSSNLPGGAPNTALRVIPAGGGVPVELARGVRRVLWTPDSRALLVLKARPERQELWLIPIDGGAPRNLGIEVHDSSGSFPFSMRPDGRRIAFVAGNSSPSWSEIWTIENVLPEARASK